MLRQRDSGAAPSVLARAEALPFGDGAFGAALASLTVHHRVLMRQHMAGILQAEGFVQCPEQQRLSPARPGLDRGLTFMSCDWQLSPELLPRQQIAGVVD